MNLAVTFKGMNDVVRRELELPCATVLQLNTSELAALPGGPGNGITVNNYRTFDVTPCRVKGAHIDALGNLAVEAESSDFYKYLLLQFSSFNI